MTTRVLAIYSYQVAMLIVSLVASRAGVMQYSLYPRGLECIIKGVPFVTFGRKGIGPRIPRIGPPQTKL